MIEFPWTKQHGIASWLKSISLFIASLIVISILTFILIFMTPGDPALTYLHASGIPESPTTILAARKHLGLDQPITVQYMHWIVQVCHGNLGVSYMFREPVLMLITKAMGNTLTLGLISFVILSISSIILAIISIFKEGGIGDIIVRTLSLICVSVPNFFFGYVLILIFALKLHLLPVSGISGQFSFVLPCITLILPLLGHTTLFLRKIFLEHLHENHTHNAQLRGVKFRFIIKNHIINNCMGAILTIFSSNILNLITGSIIVETVFSWPGIGTLFVKAVQMGDAPLIQGSILLFGILAICTNSITQWLVHWINPRNHHQKRGVSSEI